MCFSDTRIKKCKQLTVVYIQRKGAYEFAAHLHLCKEVIANSTFAAVHEEYAMAVQAKTME